MLSPFFFLYLGGVFLGTVRAVIVGIKDILVILKAYYLKEENTQESDSQKNLWRPHATFDLSWIISTSIRFEMDIFNSCYIPFTGSKLKGLTTLWIDICRLLELLHDCFPFTRL